MEQPPSRIDRLIIAVIGTIRSSIHCLRRRVGKWSRSHEAFVDFRMIVRTSLVVVGANRFIVFSTCGGPGKS